MRYQTRMPAMVEYEFGDSIRIDNVQVRNISLGGVLFASDHEFLVESEVQFNMFDLQKHFSKTLGIEQNDEEFIRIKLAGKVLRNESGADGQYAIALEFTSPLRIITQANEQIVPLQ